MKLSIIVPVFNEVYWIQKFWAKFKKAPLHSCAGIKEVEIILVDDGSTDGTRQTLATLVHEPFKFEGGLEANVCLYLQDGNQGKGAAVRRGIEASSGDIILIQDADLEYSMEDYPKLLAPIIAADADAVFGSRFVGSPRRVLYFWHSLLNRILTIFSNMLCNLNLTDMETCYKVVRGPLMRSLRLTSNRFGLEPELTSRLARANARIYEVPISYRGRTYAEGKKIGVKDGIAALFHILRFGLFDREPFKPGMDQTLTALDASSNVIYAPLLHKAMQDFQSKNSGLQILEIGSGIGSLTKHLLSFGHVVATDISDVYVEKLNERFQNEDSFEAHQWDAGTLPPPAFAQKKFDLIVSFNVLEHIENDHQALKVWNSLLKENGRLVVLVPNSPGLYSPIDKALGHFRRYTKRELETKVVSTGFQPNHLFYGNAIGILGWFYRGILLKKADLPSGQLRLYMLLKRILGSVEQWIEKFTGLSVVVVAHKK
jgi:SAM-dependent methyltransferase